MNYPTRFRSWSPACRRLVLFVALLVLILGLIASPETANWSPGLLGIPDLHLYRIVVSRVHAGAGYYHAANAALNAEGFETGSPFNWRPPAYAVLLGQLPEPMVARWLLLALSLLSVVLVVRTIVMPVVGSRGQLAALILMMGGTFAWTVYEEDAFFATEPWCEVLLLFSLSAYATERHFWGMLCATFALALRELMLPYCVIALLFAIRQRRTHECIAWLIVFTLFSLQLYFHVRVVHEYAGNTAGLGTGRWLQGFDIRGVLLTSSMNLPIRSLPPAGWAVVLPLGLIGLAGWPGSIGFRMFTTAFVFAASFSMMRAGAYWGQLYAPLIVLGLINAPASLRDLVWPMRVPSVSIDIGPTRNPDHAGDGTPAQ